jgi:NAD(P)-dependent dehydrogenase (short-subunit alcohol dehydrogenase family)
MDVNLRSSFILISFFKDLLKQSNGCVVNLSCEKGSRPDPGALGYSMVKAGLEMLTKSVALELSNFGVRVNAVAPSFVDTNLYRYSELDESDIKTLAANESLKTPLKRKYAGITAQTELKQR